MAQQAQPAPGEKIASINNVRINNEQPPELQAVEAAVRGHDMSLEAGQWLTHETGRVQDEGEVPAETLGKVVKRHMIITRQVDIVDPRTNAKTNGQKYLAAQQALLQARAEAHAIWAGSVQQVTNVRHADANDELKPIGQEKSQLNLCSDALDRSCTVTAQAVRRLEELDIKSEDMLNGKRVKRFSKKAGKMSETETIEERAYKESCEFNIGPRHIEIDLVIKSSQGPVEGDDNHHSSMLDDDPRLLWRDGLTEKLSDALINGVKIIIRVSNNAAAQRASVLAVLSKVMTKASGEGVLVPDSSDEIAVCPAAVPHYWDSEEFWFILKWTVIVVTATVFCLGCCCGCYFESLVNKILVKRAVNPAPRDAGCKAVQDRDARHKLLGTFTIVDLRMVLKAKGLAVSGVKDDLIARLINQGDILTVLQAQEIVRLQVMATTIGPLTKLNLQDISSPEAAEKWIETINWRT